MDIKPIPLKPLSLPEMEDGADLVLALSHIGGWSVGYRRGTLRIVQYGQSPDGKYKSAVLAGFTKAVELAQGRPVTFGIWPMTAKHMISEVVEAMPNMTMGHFMSHKHPGVMHMLPRPEGKKKPAAKPVSVDVYTDASMKRGNRTAGLGWVIKRGEGQSLAGNRIWNAPVADINLAEIKAVQCAVEAAVEAGTCDRIVVHSDSRHAVAWLNGKESDGSTKDRMYARATKSVLDCVPEDARIDFKWVQGHSTNVGNDSADRMAVAARRINHARLRGVERERLTESIVGDIVARMAA